MIKREPPFPQILHVLYRMEARIGWPAWSKVSASLRKPPKIR